MTDSNESNQIKPKRRFSESALIGFVMFLWHKLGLPDIWAITMIAIVISELINGMTLLGGFWVTVCLFAYYLSRIAIAVEKLGETK